MIHFNVLSHNNILNTNLIYTLPILLLLLLGIIALDRIP